MKKNYGSFGFTWVTLKAEFHIRKGNCTHAHANAESAYKHGKYDTLRTGQDGWGSVT